MIRLVGYVSFDSFLIDESHRREEPDDDMGCGRCLLVQAMLVGEWWHGRPMVVHMGNVVCAQDVQLVDQSLPAFIGPGAGAESNVAEVGGHEKMIIQNSSVRTIG